MISVNTFHKTSGITLIELMVVVAVIAIISAIALPAYNGYIRQGRTSECQKEVATIKLAEEQFFNDAGNNRFFGGANIGALATNSAGWYTPSSDVAGVTRPTNCLISVAAGPCGSLNNCYTITVVGTNALAGIPNITYSGP